MSPSGFNYEKLCPHKLHYLITRALKQLICNYIVTISWKYRELKKNAMLKICGVLL
jgi:hypothetical protein